MSTFKIAILIALSQMFFSCGNNFKEKLDNGQLFREWSFDHIETYLSEEKDRYQAKKFIKRIKVSPMRINLKDAKNGKFSAFFPDLDNDLLISRDFTGDVSFQVKSESILMTVENVKSDSKAKLQSHFFVRALSEKEMMFEINGNGILYSVYMKPL